MDQKHKKLGIDFLVLLLGNFGSRVIALLFIPLYTHVLSTSDYGIADLVTTTVQLLVPFATLNIGEAILRFTLDKDSKKDEVFCSGVRLAFKSMACVMLCTPILLFFQAIKEQYIFIVLILVASSCYTILGYFSRGIDAVKEYSIAGVISTLTLVVSNLFFLLILKIGLNGYLFSIFLSDFVPIVYLVLNKKIRRYLSITKSKYSISLSKEMLRYSGPMIPNSISWWISNSSDKYILTAFCGVAINGIYSVAYKVPSILSVMTSVFSNAWILSAVEKFGSKESNDFYDDIYNKYIKLAIVSTSFLLLSGRIIAHILFANDFFNAWRYQPILVIGVAFHALSGFLGSIYSSIKKTKMLFVSTVSGAITNIVLNFVLIPRYDAYGAAIATCISYFVVFIIRSIDSSKYLKLHVEKNNNIISVVILVFQIIILYSIDSDISVYGVLLFGILVFINRSFIISIIMPFAKKIINKSK